MTVPATADALVVTPDEIAVALKVSRAHVYRLIASGDIPKLPLPGPIRVSRAWLESMTGLCATGIATNLQPG